MTGSTVTTDPKTAIIDNVYLQINARGTDADCELTDLSDFAELQKATTAKCPRSIGGYIYSMKCGIRIPCFSHIQPTIGAQCG